MTASSFTLAVPAGAIYNLWAACPANDAVTGGGYTTPGAQAGQVSVIASYPFFNGTFWTWELIVFNASAQQINATDYAICVPGTLTGP